MNWAQKELYQDPHPFKIILKARQLGITTYFCILHLDRILWNDNKQCGIILHTRDDASAVFKDKLKFAFDNLDPRIRALFKINSDSSTELSFGHGSAIRVGTSLRSSTLQYLHISEFGKICCRYPEKAREVVTGALNTVHSGQHIVIESTAEGKEGDFARLWETAWKHKISGKPFGPLDFKPAFFSWHKHPAYTIGVKPNALKETDHLDEYFDKLALEGIKLSDPQKWWYKSKFLTQRDDMTREFPSTPEEAFTASQDGYWYASYIKELYDAGRVCNVSYDKALPVHASWDLGQRDHCSIWFFQIPRSGDINFIDFWQKTDTPLDQICIMLKSKGYNYGIHIWPHDANARDRSGITFVQQARKLNLQGIVQEPHSLLSGINLVKTTLSKCWFDKVKCAEGLRMLEGYKKRWNTTFGGWTSEPVHDICSHACDALRIGCAGIDKITASSGSLQRDMSILTKYLGN